MIKEAVRWLPILLLTGFSLQVGAEIYEGDARMRLLDEIQLDMQSILGRKLRPEVEKAIQSVPRHEFVPDQLRSRAYGNYPLPIGKDQTISQPLIVALMTDLLGVGPRDKVLEVGTGSGYQAAVLAEICEQVFSVEIIGALAYSASSRLKRLGYINVQVEHGDGLAGWPEEAPFDGIIVTAAGLDVPETLLDQLKPGGRMVIPVGAPDEVQQLKVIEKSLIGSKETNILPVRFVPVTRKIR